MGEAGPRFIDARTVRALLDTPSLMERLRAAFLDQPLAPQRLSIPTDRGGIGEAGTLLVMPAVRPGGLAVVKLVTVHPGLGDRPGGALRSTVAVLDAATGELMGMVDGHALTVKRTAAASVLAARTLASPAARRLTVLGAGAVAAELCHAYAGAFALDRIDIWARRAEAAHALADALRRDGLPAHAAPDVRTAVARADIVSAATLSRTPLILAADVRAGAHVDLVGGFRPDMREADDALMGSAIVVVDGPAAVTEAGDIAGPIAAGLLRRDAVHALADILGSGLARRPPGAVTVFKSVGCALEDLAAAELLFQRLAATDTLEALRA